MTEKPNIFVNKSRLQRWGTTLSRQRWDYHTHEHGLRDMLNATYFGPAQDEVNPSDLIYVIDKEEREVILRVDYIDEDINEVGISVYQEIMSRPVSQTFALRHVGGRGRGASYQIIDANGDIVSDPITGRSTAERELKALIEAEEQPAAA